MSEDAAYRAMLAAEGRKWGDHLKVEASGEWNAWLDHPYIAAHYRQRALVDGLSWPAFVRRELGGPAQRCLDLGCGAGARSFAVYDEGAALVLEGHDISADRIALAEQVRQARGIPGGFAVADGNAGELPAGRYGLIFSCHSFHHFLRLEHIMQQVHRALTPFGIFRAGGVCRPDPVPVDRRADRAHPRADGAGAGTAAPAALGRGQDPRGPPDAGRGGRGLAVRVDPLGRDLSAVPAVFSGRRGEKARRHAAASFLQRHHPPLRAGRCRRRRPVSTR